MCCLDRWHCPDIHVDKVHYGLSVESDLKYIKSRTDVERVNVFFNY